jgi:hypothetical protein
MKTIGRLLIAAVALLGGGLWTIFNYCNGTTGFNFGWPANNSKLTIDVTTSGTAVLVGVLLILVGLVVLAAALIVSIVVQFLPSANSDREESASKRMITLNE